MKLDCSSELKTLQSITELLLSSSTIIDDASVLLDLGSALAQELVKVRAHIFATDVVTIEEFDGLIAEHGYYYKDSVSLAAAFPWKPTDPDQS